MKTNKANCRLAEKKWWMKSHPQSKKSICLGLADICQLLLSLLLIFHVSCRAHTKSWKHKTHKDQIQLQLHTFCRSVMIVLLIFNAFQRLSWFCSAFSVAKGAIVAVTSQGGCEALWTATDTEIPPRGQSHQDQARWISPPNVYRWIKVFLECNALWSR